MNSLSGKILFISGASRGIGLAIALRAARDGANITIAAKTAEPHSKLPGTIYTAAKEIEDAGGQALPCIVDIRDDDKVQKAVDKTVNAFWGIDILSIKRQCNKPNRNPSNTYETFRLNASNQCKGNLPLFTVMLIAFNEG